MECGITEEEFWRLTPAKLAAIVTAKKEQIKREDFRTGILTMIVRAAMGVKNCHPFDFFPQHKDAPASQPRGITEPSQVRANMRAYMAAMKAYGKEG